METLFGGSGEELPYADLHTHTSCSDGRLSPGELVQKASERGLRVISVTDHDTVDGWTAAVDAGLQHGVEVIPGVELSITVDDQELHLLGYFFDPDDAALAAHLGTFRAARRRRARQMVERLGALGMPLTFEAVMQQAGDARALGRPHVAAALVEGGYVASRRAAFDRYLKDGGPACVEKPRFPAAAALEMLHAAGGIGVLAHPGYVANNDIIDKLARAGLDGLEVVHPAHNGSLRRRYRWLAAHYALLQTGGSDYHGTRQQDEHNFGTYAVSQRRVRGMRRAAVA